MIETLPRDEEKARVVEDMFDRIAPRYDLLNRVLTFRMDVAWRRAAVRALELVAGARVLDLACGTGDLCDTLEVEGYRPIGVDFSAGMLAAAHTGAPLVRADAARLPFPDRALDGLTCGFALRNFVDLESVLTECARVLRDGGRIALVDVG
jgi:demethylmenaquinone methyltransferase / 2-methoxy-6-polyprenyl-1,4-benzoquinol methylase